MEHSDRIFITTAPPSSQINILVVWFIAKKKEEKPLGISVLKIRKICLNKHLIFFTGIFWDICVFLWVYITLLNHYSSLKIDFFCYYFQHFRHNTVFIDYARKSINRVNMVVLKHIARGEAFVESAPLTQCFSTQRKLHQHKLLWNAPILLISYKIGCSSVSAHHLFNLPDVSEKFLLHPQADKH